MAKSKYSILIICEGKNTEPYFFNSIRDEIINKKYDIDDCVITVRPEVKNEEEEAIAKSTNKPNFKTRTTRKALIGNEPLEIKGVPPLKWVEAGKEELRNGTFNEVWAVFDHDNHPARKEAFEAADEEIDGLKVKIAFSSRSFEYYLLLHFEQIYNKFIETDCNTGGKSPKSLVCATGVHPNDCNGKTCINGYARLKGYWDNSKEDKSLFPLIKDNIELGFINSEWLRALSNIHENEVEIYNRNPFVTTDKLVRRLTGNNGIYWQWVFVNELAKTTAIEIKSLEKNEILITNISDSIIIIPSGSFTKYKTNNQQEFFGDKIILYPKNTKDKANKVSIKLEDKEKKNILFFIFKNGNFKYVFENQI